IMKNILQNVSLAVLLVILGSCNPDKKAKEQLKERVDQELELDQEVMNDLQKAKQVFYSLPSPIEMAMLLKRAGTQYDPQLINPTENADKYTTTIQKSLNFGVYGADLSYANLFMQTQTSIQLMAVSKKLADGMGIYGYIDDNIVERLENNVNNRDSSMAIITEVFMSSNSYLSESGRPETGVLILAGGWIEALYIATQLTRTSPNNNELIDRIIDQKLSLVTLHALLTKYGYHPDVKKTLGMINEIKTFYDQIQIVTTKAEPITDNESKLTTLQSKSEIFISQEVFDNLCLKVDSIRKSITEI
ncbi:MAG TPA: hypothetical protein DEQ03_07885, partial [Marinilabiliales bacterium]|nr:hypothetical protein [Marinilabiliales bacterium]